MTTGRINQVTTLRDSREGFPPPRNLLADRTAGRRGPVSGRQAFFLVSLPKYLFLDNTQVAAGGTPAACAFGIRHRPATRASPCFPISQVLGELPLSRGQRSRPSMKATPTRVQAEPPEWSTNTTVRACLQVVRCTGLAIGK